MYYNKSRVTGEFEIPDNYDDTAKTADRVQKLKAEIELKEISKPSTHTSGPLDPCASFFKRVCFISF
jgi:hypothetical protein